MFYGIEILALEILALELPAEVPIFAHSSLEVTNHTLAKRTPNHCFNVTARQVVYDGID